MGVIVNFDYGAWITRYPEFSSVINTFIGTGSINGVDLNIASVISGEIDLGTLISGPGVQPGTYVEAFSGGVGNTGDYTVNYGQIVGVGTALTGVIPQISVLQANEYFAEACIYNRNDGGGPVRNAVVQQTLLNMVTAHIAKLNAMLNGSPASPLVGRIASASQGPVNVSVDMGAQPQSAAWWQQTQYGAAYWQAAAPYRTMRYIPSRGNALFGTPGFGFGIYRRGF